MPASGPDSIRLVIQRVSGVAPGSVSYRMIAYPDRQGLRFKPSHLSSRAEILARLAEAIPAFDQKQVRPDSGATQVLFAANLDLTDAQLMKLGVAYKSDAPAGIK